eukprot:TRINITY_DN13632_c0_g3_i1.p1 TRINITY_DN13632_c0_g3~~TRINITY_DN13632_c0_g3_i1.p1  ORF type:complete len:301 (-),score=79.81 TRINITY_DN13632_c0_g3_i1:7-882(-)
MSSDAAAEEAEGAQKNEQEEADVFAGEKTHSFRSGALVVHTFEDFMENAIGGVITRASKDLARWAAEVAPEGQWRACQTVELGSGCGLVSSVLMKLGADVTVTDMQELLPHLEYNLGLNAEQGCGQRSIQALDWGSQNDRDALRRRLGPQGASAIFAANCVYSIDTVEIFLATVKALSGPETLALMCGVPVPPEAEHDVTMIDALLAACPDFFDSYLLEVPGGAANAGVGKRLQSSPLAASLGKPHGLTAAALADGIWLFKLPGSPCPSWLRPLLKLEAAATSRTESLDGA